MYLNLFLFWGLQEIFAGSLVADSVPQFVALGYINTGCRRFLMTVLFPLYMLPLGDWLRLNFCKHNHISTQGTRKYIKIIKKRKPREQVSRLLRAVDSSPQRVERKKGLWRTGYLVNPS